MATARKHWFRVPDEVQYEPWSNDVAAAYLRLGAHLNTRWAREGRNGEDASCVVLSRATAMQLTGSGSLARARSILRELATHVSLVIDEQGTNTSVRWPKFAEFQKYESGPGARVETVGSPAVPPPQDAPAPAPARRKTQKKESASRHGSAVKPAGVNSTQRASPTPKPSSRAIAVWWEEYKAARGIGVRPAPNHHRELGEQFELYGEEAFREALRIHFKREDAWIRDASYSAGTFLSQCEQYFARAQRQIENSKRPKPKLAPEPEEDRVTPSDMFAMFGRAK